MDEGTSFAPFLSIYCKHCNEFGTRGTFPAMAAEAFAETLNTAKFPARIPSVLLSPMETASPRKEERSFGAHRRRFVVKVETDTQGSILDHLDVHSNVR